MKIIVTTYDNETDSTDSERVIDFGIKETRSWLWKHITWCVNNGKTVEVSETDES